MENALASPADPLSWVKSLEQDEVFVFYDEPLFYSCRDVSGKRCLVYWVDDDGTYNIWLYVTIDEDRYQRFKNDEMPSCEALTPDGSAFALLACVSKTDVQLRPLSSEQVDQDWLPQPDAYFSTFADLRP